MSKADPVPGVKVSISIGPQLVNPLGYVDFFFLIDLVYGASDTILESCQDLTSFCNNILEWEGEMGFSRAQG